MHIFRNIIFNLLFIFSFNLFSQTFADDPLLNEEFIGSLPPEVVESLKQSNKRDQKEDRDLLRYDTSIKDTELLIDSLQQQIDELKIRLNNDQNNKKSVERFGSEFFSTIQTTFAPFDLANFTDEYILGPGDKLDVSLISSERNDSFTATINKRGVLIIPNVGEVNISGTSVSNAASLLSSYVSSKIIGSEIFISLTELKDIQVIVLGYVSNPGIYTIAGNSNYIHALNVAGGINDSGSFRNIEHIRGDTLVKNFDLYDTFVNGDVSYFSTLRSGDVIFVKPKNFSISLAGGVNYEGIFEIRSGETVGDIIEFAGGFSEESFGFKNLLVKRVFDGKTKEILLPLESINSFKIEPRDSFIVPFLDLEPENLRLVEIKGEVVNPGKYFINKNETLSSLIKKAGGYTKYAYIYGSALFRQSTLEKEFQFAQRNYEDTLNFIINNLGTPNTVIDVNAINLISEELKAKNLSGRIITNFNIDDISSNDDINLEDDDYILIPRLSKVVYMFGEFNNPVTAIYQPEFSVSDYIKISGGIKDTSINDILIIDPDGKTKIHRVSKLSFFNDNIQIYPGSIVYAPRDIGKLRGINYAATVSPILSSLALSLASLNSISN